MMKCPTGASPVDKIQSVPCRLVGHYVFTWDTMLCLLGTVGLQDYDHITRELEVNSSRGKLSVVCLKMLLDMLHQFPRAISGAVCLDALYGL